MDALSTLTLAAVAALVLHSPRSALRSDGRPAALAAAAACACWLLIGLAAWRAPSTFHAWAQEDAWIEWLTVFLLLAGALRFGRLALLARGGFRAVAWLGVLGCLGIAGEEISWGQRLLAVAPPEYLLRHNFQQELNLHNLLQGEQAPVRIASKHLVIALAAALGLAALGSRWWLADRLPPAWLAPHALGAIWLELAYPMELAGEVAELFVCAVLAASSWRWSPRPTVVRLGLSLAAAAAAVAAVIFATDHLRRHDPRIATAQAEVDALLPGLAASATPRLFEKRRIHKRVYTAVEAGYFTLQPSPEDRRRRYFLDPWGNPYWVSWDRRAGALRLYSFGPNARRDADDVWALIELPRASPPLGQVGGPSP